MWCVNVTPRLPCYEDVNRWSLVNLDDFDGHSGLSKMTSTWVKQGSPSSSESCKQYSDPLLVDDSFREFYSTITIHCYPLYIGEYHHSWIEQSRSQPTNRTPGFAFCQVNACERLGFAAAPWSVTWLSLRWSIDVVATWSAEKERLHLHSNMIRYGWNICRGLHQRRKWLCHTLLDDFGGLRGHVDQAAAGFGDITAADICFSSPHSDMDFFSATAAWQISEGQSTLGTFACVFMLFNVVPANSEF